MTSQLSLIKPIYLNFFLFYPSLFESIRVYPSLSESIQVYPRFQVDLTQQNGHQIDDYIIKIMIFF